MKGEIDRERIKDIFDCLYLAKWGRYTPERAIKTLNNIGFNTIKIDDMDNNIHYELNIEFGSQETYAKYIDSIISYITGELTE